MTQAQLDLILALPMEEQIAALQKSSFVIPKWADLEKQYDSLQHEILTNTAKYPPKINPQTGADDIKRTVFALQKLAVSRISQQMFSAPVKREYDFDRDKESEKDAIGILEQIYRTENSIDGSNLERSKKLNASCQIVTIWSTIEKPSKAKGEESPLTLTHATYSPMDGYSIFTQTDENGEILTIGISYKDIDEKEHFIVYISGVKPRVIKYEKLEEGWAIITELSKDLPFFPCVWSYLGQPVWGGDSGTNKVEQLEEMETYQGFYVRKNQAPLFGMDPGKTAGTSNSTTDQKDDDARNIVRLGEGGSITGVTWVGAGVQLTERMERIRNAFFEENQFPDNSFSTLIKSNTSADNKEIVFADAKAKAIDLGGEWEKFFLNEIKIVKEFVKVMFKSTANDLDMISARTTIKPYNIRTKKDNAEYVNIAGSSMSLETQIITLDEVSDVEQEAEAIRGERSASANQGL